MKNYKLLNQIDHVLKASVPNDLTYEINTTPISNLKDVLGFDYFKFIPAPPTNNSESTLLDLKELERITQELTPKQIKFIYAVDREPIDVFNDYLTQYKAKVPVKIFKPLYEEYVKTIITDLKNFFNRPRPIQLAKILNIDIKVIETKTHQTPAYPSGHSAYAFLLAHVCADFYPNHKKELFELANQCGYARMLQGVHYRSDHNASKLLISKLYPKLKNLHNKLKLKALKKEL
tara:strand:+ start:10088 stop:10786 length:699 start_codon:yes stop_codon:yes gene_type:complete